MSLLLSHSRFSGSSSKMPSSGPAPSAELAVKAPGAPASARSNALAPERGGATTNTGRSIMALVNRMRSQIDPPPAR